MAAEERTEQATPRRRQDAREKGQVVKSIEVNAAFGLLASALALKALGPMMVNTWSVFAHKQFVSVGNLTVTPSFVQRLLFQSSVVFLQLILPLLLVVMVVAILTNVLQSGLVFSGKAMTPDFNRLNPFNGFTRMFSQRSAVELIKSCLKSLLIGYIIYSFFNDRQGDLLDLIKKDPRLIGGSIFDLCTGLLLKASLLLIAISVADYVFQRWQFEKSIRMTKQEIKEEYKRTEGDPLTKSRTRQRQREMARKRMMADVSKATVVVTNPTHLAVALLYEPGVTPAPTVIAKGQRLIAEKIKLTAGLHNIPIIENKPLARTLFSQCEVGDMIPEDLYQAVAAVIAFVFRQAGRTARTQES